MKKRVNLIVIFLIIMLVILALAIILFLIRAFSSKQLDDVSPGIQCDKELLEKNGVYANLWNHQTGGFLE